MVLMLISITHICMAQHKTAYLKTPGITCEDCETYVENQLMRVNGMLEVDVNPYAKTTRVVYIATRIDVTEIKYQIADLGFIADDIMPDIAIFTKMPACCREAAKKSYDLAKAASLMPKPVQPTPAALKKDTVKVTPKQTLPVKPISIKPIKPALGLKPAIPTKQVLGTKPTTIKPPLPIKKG